VVQLCIEEALMIRLRVSEHEAAPAVDPEALEDAERHERLLEIAARQGR
jgi:hypothetical protein